MRPHRLRVTAFGPFPGTVELDFDEVSAAGPFLLRGATGAGKTSLLDAVGFALFGKVPGSRGLKQLRSDHAAAGVRTSVELWATVSGRAVHVVRTPDQLRPRTRGTGWTTDRATVSLRVARDLAALEADECDLRLAGVQEANDELAGLVGMTHEQFVQVVLLPQGDFARFLRAKDDERAGVLRALFDTSRFTAVEEHLRARRDATRQALAGARTEVTEAAARVAAHVGEDDPGQDGPPGEDLPAWADGLHEAARRAVAEAEGAVGTATTSLATARDAASVATTRTRLSREVVEVVDTRERLLHEAEQVAGLAQELADAERASRAAALHEVHLAARERAAEALSRTTGALAALPGPERPFELPADVADVERLGAVADRLVVRLDGEVVEATADQARLEALGRQVQRRQQLGEDAAVAETEVTRARTELDERRAACEALPGRVAAVAAEIDRLRPVAADLSDAEHGLRRWQQAGERAAALRVLQERAVQAEREDLRVRAARREADGRLDGLRAARLAGMSAELATSLRPGQACGVCGSTDHPAPARPGDAPLVTAEDEDRAGAVAAARARETEAAAADLAGVRTGRDAAHAELLALAAPEVEVPDAGSDPDAAGRFEQVLAAEQERAAGRLLVARQAAADLVDRTTQLEALRAEQVGTAQALSETDSRMAGLTAALSAARAQAAAVDEELTAALGASDRPPAEVWRERSERATGSLRRVREAATAAAGLVAACEDLARTEREVAERCVADGWGRPGDAVAAARPRPWCEQARREVAAHERDLHAATVRLAALETELEAAGAGAGAEVAPGTPEGHGVLPARDQARARERLRRAEQDEGEAAERARLAEDRCRAQHDALSARRVVLRGLDRTVPVLLRTVRGAGPLLAEAEAARALADLCTGANDKQIPLSTYVLAAHLEHVVQAANQRLHGMSEGRYALVHVEEGEDRRRRAGLGLAVLDAWTGVRRPAGTLSGGETFLASLALALGLADVVAAEAGGVRIDALFVDEGFGTLDPDSLDRAMDVLDQLQEHGRMVGVVSHVGELRQRLPRQVHVEGGRTGSTVRVLAG